MIYVKEHMLLLGMKVKDRVTGFNGVVSSISFDLYGCVQAIVAPGVTKNGEMRESKWFDINRLKVTGYFPVMDIPDFSMGLSAEGKKGAAEKPQGKF